MSVMPLAKHRGHLPRNACKEHCASYFTSFILEAVIWSSLLFILFMFFIDESAGINLDPTFFIPAGVAYFVYILHLACCVRLTRAFVNQTEGIESALSLDIGDTESWYARLSNSTIRSPLFALN